MITTVPRTPTLGSPRRPALDRPAAMTLAETAYQRFLAQLHDLSDDDWSRPTDCPAWDVRALHAPEQPAGRRPSCPGG